MAQFDSQDALIFGGAGLGLALLAIFAARSGGGGGVTVSAPSPVSSQALLAEATSANQSSADVAKAAISGITSAGNAGIAARSAVLQNYIADADANYQTSVNAQTADNAALYTYYGLESTNAANQNIAYNTNAAGEAIATTNANAAENIASTGANAQVQVANDQANAQVTTAHINEQGSIWGNVIKGIFSFL